MRIPYQNELMHYGIQGQKWGIRRYQNPDGTLTAEGKARYGDEGPRRYKDSNAYERHMMRKEKGSVRRLNRAKNKLERADSIAERTRVEEKVNRRLDRLNRYSDAAEAYYSLDKDKQRSINRAFHAARAVPIMTGGGIIPVLASYGAFTAYANSESRMGRGTKSL